MQEVLNLHSESRLGHRLDVLLSERELWHHAWEAWPFASALASGESAASSVSTRRSEAVAERDGGVTEVILGDGYCYAHAYAASASAAAALLGQLREEFPPARLEDPAMVPVTFWSLSIRGPQSIRRLIDAPAWQEVQENYPGGEDLAALLGEWSPGIGGQLLLWHGDAGTGKTTALRSLGREWREWAELHYIVDPDKFFGDSAAYMMQVMMGGEERVLGPEGERSEPPWRVLVLEDCGEMLEPDARREVGQALSRLLNACDGLIGRGLRLLILITTNEPLEKVHPAVSRPGRCAARIEFERFAPLMARDWLERRGAELPTGGLQGASTLADLYAIAEERRSQTARRPVGFATV